MEERYHASTQNRFYPDVYVNKNITVEAKLISPPTYNVLLGATVQNLVAWVTRHQEFVHPSY